MELNIKFSLELEQERVDFTFSKLDWYNAKGYRPILPKTPLKLAEEYSQEPYLQTKSRIIQEYSQLKSQIEEALSKMSNIPSNVEIILTRYGTMGSYHLPNKIIINIENLFPLKTIIHEIIHLSIEEEIKKNHIGHEEKESRVNKLFVENFGFLNSKLAS